MIQPNADGLISATDILSQLTDRTRVVLLTHVSNVTGLILPIQEIAAQCRKHGVITILDAAQSAAHLPLNVKELAVDFLTFSGHKLFGPTGIGVLVIAKQLHEQLEPWVVGGGMVDTVGETSAKWSDAPLKFEAGTPPIAEAIGLARAIDWIQNNGGIAAIHHSEMILYGALIAELQQIPDLTLIGYSGDAQLHTSCASFTIDGVHGHDIAAVLAERNIAVRAGHHCCQPLMKHFGVSSTTRVSLAPYNTLDDIHELAVALKSIKTILGS
jgi:cysteine desulfurase/selenocysteine lyase